MSGKLYGVGVGPGDPELMTLKAVRIIKDADVIVIPTKDKESCVAYQIAKKTVEGLEQKECFCFKIPMTKEEVILKKMYGEVAEAIGRLLSTNKKVVYLTLGDPTVYSTYMYVHEIIQKAGYETEIINGITSFCAAAAKSGISLGERQEAIHIIPASYGVEQALTLTGTKILMKSGKALEVLKDRLKDTAVYAVQNCGMENEKITNKLSELSTENSYYTTIIIKQNIDIES